MTVRQLVQSALRMSGGLRVGQLGHTDDEDAALLILNSMVSTWNTKRLNIFTIRRDTYILAGGQNSYTIGQGGDIDAQRPAKIVSAGLFIAGDTLIERPLKILLTVQEWADVRIKTLSTSVPYRLYCDYAHPTANIYLWPTPDGHATLALYTWQRLAQFSAITDAIDLPDGYLDALRYNLAVAISVEWGQRLNDPTEVRRLARKSLYDVQCLNTPDYIMTPDSGIGGMGGGYYDYRSGGSD